MLRPALVFFCLLGIAPVLAQVGGVSGGGQGSIVVRTETFPNRKPESTTKVDKATKAKIVNLLRSSHGLNEQLSERDRLRALQRQAMAASRAQADVAPAWAEELFQAAKDATTGQEREWAQAQAVEAMAESDPDRALTMLAGVERADPPVGTTGTFDRLGMTARSVFAKALTLHGAAVVPVLQSLAQQMGEQGWYPYGAMGQVITTVGSKDAEVSQSLFNQAAAFYEQNATTPTADHDFAELLRQTAGSMPRPAAKNAVDLLVNNILARNYDSQQHMTATYTMAGSTVQLTDPAEIELSRLSYLIRTYDPDLAAKLAKDRPLLGVLLTQSRPAPVRMSMTSAPAVAGASAQSGMATRIAEARVMREIQSTAVSDPQKAMSLAATLPSDSARARVLSNMAVQSPDPQQANAILDEAEQLAQRTHDLRTELEVVVGRAEAAHRSEDSAQLNIALQRGFGLGNELLRKEQDEHPGTSGISVYFLGRLVRAGMTSNPDLVMGYIDIIPWPYCKATLLVDGAEALLNERLVVGSVRTSLAPDRAGVR